MTKGDILKSLSSQLEIFNIPDFIHFTVDEWNNDRENLIRKILFIESDVLVVRSSALGEDSLENSKAGEYESILNVKKSKSDILIAVKRVIDSYKKKNNINGLNKIIVQKQISEILLSGVIFTRELNTGAPYYVINYDDKSGSTQSVTSGSGEYSNRTIYILRDINEDEIKSRRFKIIFQAIKELEIKMDSNLLDVEFALDTLFKPQLFQVRSITTSKYWQNNQDEFIFDLIKKTSFYFERYTFKEKFLFGEFSILSQMSDWNPVELIGKSPRRLDYSLYRKLITESSWRIARGNMGYRHNLGKALMSSICGQPYIDTRLSFNSYLPKDLDNNLADKLVNSWLQKLKLNPFLHDKIEFEIAITCYSFDLEEKLRNNYNQKFNESEIQRIKETYRSLTLDFINKDSKGSIENAISKINELNQILERDYKPLEKLKLSEINGLIEVIKSKGIIPFAIIARHGFVAKTLLDSLNEKYKLLDDDELQSFLRSIPTVASEFSLDSSLLSKDELEESLFFERYGHLRPGTYDITSLRYDQMDKKIFSTSATENFIESKHEFKEHHKDKLKKILIEHGFKNITNDLFLEYIVSAIKNREYAKFVFTKGISTILEIIAKYFSEYNINREEASNFDVEEILNFYYSIEKDDFEGYLRDIISKRNEDVFLSHSLRLPQVITNSSDLKIIPFQVSQPNFITKLSVESDIFYLKSINDLREINGKIVLIENADPGYDFIFNYDIKGLITMYGGANSHMAIRCAEFNLPAAIGCGEQIFDSLKNRTKKIILDCLQNKINKIA